MTADEATALSRFRSDHLSHEMATRGFTVTREGDVDWGPAASGGEADLAVAEAAYRRGDTAEALIWLERALPDTFAGLSDRVIPRHGARP